MDRYTISIATAFDQGNEFHADREVREYFTVENHRSMFPDDEVYRPTQAELDEMAETVIANRWHYAEDELVDGIQYRRRA